MNLFLIFKIKWVYIYVLFYLFHKIYYKVCK